MIEFRKGRGRGRSRLPAHHDSMREHEVEETMRAVNHRVLDHVSGANKLRIVIGEIVGGSRCCCEAVWCGGAAADRQHDDACHLRKVVESDAGSNHLFRAVNHRVPDTLLKGKLSS